MTHRFAALACTLAVAACSSTGPGSPQRQTAMIEASDYFDEGLTLCWGFNHDEAVRMFEEAIRLDPDSAMAWWGIAYALGPNINLPLTDESLALRAHAAAQKAFELADQASPVERALIQAMTTRFTDPPPADRSGLDQAYAAAMKSVWERYPDDALVGVLFADSMMNLSRDWRSWPVDGDRGPRTPEIVATLESALARYPDHAGANHFYVHSVEASDRPGRALEASNRLTTLVPEAGHLVHMPSHIYIRLGKYYEAVETNANSVAADDAFFSDAGEQGIYHYYRAHNHHFLIWSAMFLGARERALTAARDMVSKLPMESLDTLPRSIESYLFVPVHVMMRFGMWEKILEEPLPVEEFPIAVALAHHARGVAYANTGRLSEAAEEQAAFERVATTIPEDTTVRRANIRTVIEIARGMMEGEILFKQGQYDEAFAALRRAVAAEDTIPYSEPPGWMQPIRHALGALLLEAGRLEEAEAVYREDLAQHAENGWSLHGLAESLRRQGRTLEADDAEQRFRIAWAYADVEIEASCFCRS